MRFDRVQARRFGGLADLDTGAEPLPPLVVVAGPNEAGKSTFFRLLTSLLYGFAPANREQNRDVPWDGEEADGSAWIQSDAGQALHVRRVLRSTPWGKLTMDGHEEDLRNRPVPTLDRLPRTVFRQVFALTLAEVRGLEADSWAEVQDRLVSALGARDLVAPRDAADRLSDEAGGLWRPNRRGKQAIRTIGEQIHRAERLRDEARERDREIRDLVGRVAEARATLRRQQQERESIQRSEERVSRLLPVHRQILRIQELEQLAGDPRELAGLPSDPAERLAGLRERSANLAVRAQELEVLRSGLVENLRRVGSIGRELQGDGWSTERRVGIRTVRPNVVRERVRDWLDARDRRRLEDAEVAGGRYRVLGERAAVAWALLCLMGISTLASGIALGLAWLWGLGMGAFLVGAVRLWRMLRTPMSTAESELRREEEAALEAVRGALVDAALRPEILEEPSLELPGLLQRLQELDRDVEAQIGLARDAVPDSPPAAPDSAEPGQLSLGFIPEAVGAPDGRGDEDPAADALARLAMARGRLVSEREASEADRRALEARLSLLGDGDADRGARAAAERLAAGRRARELAEDLARHGGLQAAREEIGRALASGESWTSDPDAALTLQRRRVELTSRIEHLGRSVERHDQAIVHARELPTADEVEGEILALTEERIRMARERDRKVLLARLVRIADERFRSERQPRVLRRAGEYLGSITDGRYDGIITADEGDRQVFKLVGHAHAHPVGLGRGVSAGTREQAYLALRLAAVEELDGDGERLPVFVDEVFVNWDEDRRRRGIELMSALAETRQVFVFTCHSEVAQALEHGGGRTVALEAGRLRSLEEAR